MTTALKLTQKTILIIAGATHLRPTEVNDIYESCCNNGTTGYVVLNDVCKHGDLQPPLLVMETDFNTDFMFVKEPTENSFTEVIHI